MVKPSGSLMEDALFDPHNHSKLPKNHLKQAAFHVNAE